MPKAHTIPCKCGIYQRPIDATLCFRCREAARLEAIDKERLELQEEYARQRQPQPEPPKEPEEPRPLYCGCCLTGGKYNFDVRIDKKWGPICSRCLEKHHGGGREWNAAASYGMGPRTNSAYPNRIR